MSKKWSLTVDHSGDETFAWLWRYDKNGKIHGHVVMKIEPSGDKNKLLSSLVKDANRNTKP